MAEETRPTQAGPGGGARLMRPIDTAMAALRQIWRMNHVQDADAPAPLCGQAT